MTQTSPRRTEMKGLLVGTQFHQPGRSVLAHLATGTEVLLEAEPQNPYDSEAVGVFVSPREVPESEHEALSKDLRGCGWTLEDLLHTDRIQLGYLGRESGKQLKIFRERNPSLELFGASSFLESCSARLEWTNFGQDLLVITEDLQNDQS